MMIVFQKGRVGLEFAVFWSWWRVRLIVRRSSVYTRTSFVRHGWTLEIHVGPLNLALSLFGKRLRRPTEQEDDHASGEPYEPPEMAEILEG